MKLELNLGEAAAVDGPLLAVMAVDAAEGAEAEPEIVLPGVPDAIQEAAAKWLDGLEFKAVANEILLVHAPAGVKSERLLLVGLGKAKKAGTQQVRQAAGTAVRLAKAKGLKRLALLMPGEGFASSLAESIQAAVEGALLGEVETDTYKSQRKDRSLDALTILAPAGSDEAIAREALRRGEILGAAQNFARALALEPGNVMTPTELGRRTAAMCAEAGLTCEVHGTEKLRALKMGAFLGVTQGSPEEPALIVMRYEPESSPAEGSPVIALVGKGITFDTGGISIKPADGMEKMKYDMAGAAAMIGAMQAIAGLRPKVRVLGIVCSAENMPDGKAYKPGDVLTAMSGKTIEVTNTDAEGRLVLADGLHYAKTLGATHLIDAATLTGAVAVALGRLNAGLFSNDEESCDRFLQAMRRAGEHFWRLPCTDEYRDLIKSGIADIQNTGIDRWGGAITAAMFLKEFAGETPWVHLDIAAMAWVDEAKPWLAKGPTGVAVRSVVEWVRGYDGAAGA